MATEEGNQEIGVEAPILAGVVQVKNPKIGSGKTFYVSKALLRKHAPTLLSILKKQKQKTSVIEEDEDVNSAEFLVFILWMAWLDKNEESEGNPLPMSLYWSSTAALGSNIWSLIVAILKIYAFGLKYSIRDFCKSMVDYLSFCIEEFSNIQQVGEQQEQIRIASMAIRHGYVLTMGPCRLRNILVEGFYANKLDRSLSRTDLKEFPKEFLEDIVLRRVTLPGHEGCASGARKSLKRQSAENEEASRKKQKVNSSSEDAVSG